MQGITAGFVVRTGHSLAEFGTGQLRGRTRASEYGSSCGEVAVDFLRFSCLAQRGYSRRQRIPHPNRVARQLLAGTSIWLPGLQSRAHGQSSDLNHIP